MIVSSQTDSQVPAAPLASQAIQTTTAIAQTTTTSQEPYKHKLNQVNLRTLSNHNQHQHEMLLRENSATGEQVSAVEEATARTPSGQQVQQQGVDYRPAFSEKRRRSRADSSRLSVILPPNNQAIIDQQPQHLQPEGRQLGSSLETPIAILSSQSDAASQQFPSLHLPQQNSHNHHHHLQQPPAPSSGYQLYQSLMQFNGQDCRFTGLPSCTPTSADALAASANLRTINPFFLNVGPFAHNCDNSVAQQQLQQQHGDDPQSIPEDLSPSTKTRPTAGADCQTSLTTSNTNNNSPIKLGQLTHLPAGTLMLSPLSFLLSPEHDAWLRLNLANPANPHPLAGKSAPQQMPIFDDSLYRTSQQQHAQTDQQQQSRGSESTTNRQRPLEAGGVTDKSSSSARLAQDLTNQQQFIGQQQQQPRASMAAGVATALATRPTVTIANDPPIISSAAQATTVATTLAPSTQHSIINQTDKTAATALSTATPTNATTAIASSIAPSAQQTSGMAGHAAMRAVSLGQQYQMQQAGCPATSYVIFANHHPDEHPAATNQHQPPLDNNSIPAGQRQSHIAQQQPTAQKQIFIPVHQQQPLAQSQPIQPVLLQHQQTRPLSARDSVLPVESVASAPNRSCLAPQEQQQQQPAYLYGPSRYIHPQQQAQPQPFRSYSSSPSPHQQERQSCTRRLTRNESRSSESSNKELKLNGSSQDLSSCSQSGLTLAQTAKTHDMSMKDSVFASNGLNSNSDGSLNCGSPIMMDSSSSSSSSSSSARSSISRDTSTSVDVVMATLKQQQPSLQQVSSNDEQLKIKRGKTTTTSKITSAGNDAISIAGGQMVDGEAVPVVKKKSKGGRKKKQVTHEEMMARKNRSKERNRVAAKRCRQKRKQFIDDLCAKIDNINDLNRKLLKENAQLKEEVNKLKEKQQE